MSQSSNKISKGTFENHASLFFCLSVDDREKPASLASARGSGRNAGIDPRSRFRFEKPYLELCSSTRDYGCFEIVLHCCPYSKLEEWNLDDRDVAYDYPA